VIRRIAAIAFAVALAAPSWAASKDIERLQAQIATLSSQIADIQRQSESHLKEIQRLNESLAEQGALVRRTLQDKRIQDEALQLALKDITDRLGEIQERLQAVQGGGALATTSGGVPASPPEGAAGAPSSAGGTPGLTGAPPPAPRELYSQAYADYARGNYDLSIQGFQEYLRTYPSTEFSDNAQYWIGECLYGKQKYAEAIEAWNALFRDFPSSDKLPDARFKKGLALERLGRRSQALVEYRYVVDRYPNSEAGRKAREKLNAQ
jgi:tol-pal system protein YbgF